MAGEKHLLLTATGSYSDATLKAETWAVNVRLALVFGSIDPISTFPTNWDLVDTTISRTESLWDITGNWSVLSGSAVFNPDDFLNDQAAPAFTAWIAAGPISQGTIIETLKLAPISSPLGREVPAPGFTSGSPCLLTWTSSNPAGFAAGLLPLQDSIVVSHKTAQTGRRGRGRMYLPGLNPAQSVGSTGYVSTGGQANALAGQQALLGALTGGITGVGTAHWQPVITGKPYVNYAVINEVAVGNVVDTQRRRRRSLPETYVSGPV